MRRALLFFVVSVVCVVHAFDFATVTPGRTIEFPRDAGSHPDYRIEWWYVTGHLDSKAGPLGFQVTFFRLRNPDADANPSRFSPKELLFAHAALSDPRKPRILQDQRSARSLAGLVEASTTDTNVAIDDWSLQRDGRGYAARVRAETFVLDLALEPTQAVLLQGERGYSRKDADARRASYYYSEPQLRVRGKVAMGGESVEVTGVAWLDHEWSSEVLAPEAVGWDWLGANLDDGRSLMAFRIRGSDGATRWASATSRDAAGVTRTFTGDSVRFTPRETWKSPRTGTTYPVTMDVAIAGETWHLEPLLKDQELDARESTGTLYWEGAVRVEGPHGERGRGYLELTGYAERLRF